MATGIFISYRRQDAIAQARAVYERLRREFGDEHVFIDLEGLAIGEDFVEALERQLAQCHVMLVLIGPQWLQATDGRGRRRLEQTNDFVRLELATALARRGVRVVPLLIDGTDMPGEDELPADLHPLLRRQALSLRFANFDADARHLVAGLRKMPALQPLVALPVPTDQPSKAQPTVIAVPSRAGAQPSRPEWVSGTGEDDFGRWAEFTVKGVMQQLRWVPPGEFLMGSPADEPERFNNEGPQHRVRITRGFWLADTACTQALWLAVMGGNNPARFDDDLSCPVEQVSHDDVRQFLSRLRQVLGAGADPVLPTEAQWEYACRAGTNTPFSFGAQASTDQVNFDGNHPYNGGPKGVYRQRTVAVKSLPPNPLGLFEMHGNVWEWCADGGLRQYRGLPAGRAIEDPIQRLRQGHDAHFAVRGGSWFLRARLARSAYRFACQGRSSYRYLGFRLALKSPD